MKSARDCAGRREDLVALVMGELDATAAAELQSHLAVCQTCWTMRDALAHEEKDVRAGFAAIADRLGSLEPIIAVRQTLAPATANAPRNTSNNQIQTLQRIKKMIATHKRLSAAAAAMAALAAGLVLYVCVFSGATAAYALEQTAEANRQVRSCHVKIIPALRGAGEVWLEMDADGTPLRARLDFPKTEDGAKVVILVPGKAEVWFKDKHSHLFVTDKQALANMKMMQEQFDPKAAFESLEKAKESGKADVSTKEPKKAGEPITLTVTRKGEPDDRAVYTVNPATKLVERMTSCHRRAGEWREEWRVEYLDYNKPIDPKVFQLDLPKDVMTINQITQKIGLEKGKLGNDEIAMRVAREFFEALIAEDYKKAGLLLEGLPADKIKEEYGRLKVQRIIAVGKPVAGLHPDKTALQVPVTVEANGQKKEFKPFIRPVYSHPDRWGICGGI